jgi:CubicO group peptidase (beta-lactamase class C family)
LRAQRAAQTPAQTLPAPVLDPTPLFFIDPAQPLLPYQTPEAVAAAMDPIAAALLPLAAAAAAALLPGVSASASSTLHARAPVTLVLAPSGGFDGSSRFERFLQARFAPVQPIAPRVNTPVVSRAPVLTDATGGRVLVAVAGGGRGTGVNTPFGHVSVSHGDYVFGNTRYPIASIGGVLTTALVSLAALAGIAALLAAIAAVGRFLEASARRGRERTREELYAAARRKNIPGRSRMSKAELRRALDER